MQTQVQGFYDPATGSISYVVYDQPGGHAAIIDPVLDYEPASGRLSTGSADQLIAYVQQQGLQLVWLLETHAHADHLTAAAYLQGKLGGQIAIGAGITQVQTTFAALFNLANFPCDGSQFDRLWQPDEQFQIGQLPAQALAVPGHTPADLAYRIGDALFLGDTLFMPDLGSARCDFPGGDAHALFQSTQKILALPDETRLFMCHDYPRPGRDPQWQSTVAEQKRSNIHLHAGVAEQDFIAMRRARDQTLGMPRLIWPALQLNIRAGHWPEPEDNGRRYFKIPLQMDA